MIMWFSELLAGKLDFYQHCGCLLVTFNSSSITVPIQMCICHRPGVISNVHMFMA